MIDPINALEAGKTLTIDLNEEYKIKIEKPSELSDSFFKDIYKKAAGAVIDIIAQTEKNDPKNNSELDVNDPFYNEKQDYNNIIAFCGERGTGKSSAMITFAQSLIKIKETKEFYDKTEKLRDKKFETINVIDPSLFEEDENIFEVILAQLFSRFEKELENKEQNKDIDNKRKLLEKFEKVYENLQTIKKDGQKYDGEALETLSKLACGANLRNNFKDLVKLLLDFITKEKEDAYLIIPIDDFDLNVSTVADMAEQIRKYLMIPRVVVLMAVKIEQLADAKEQKVREDFKTLLKSNSRHNDPIDISLKYLSKLIPENRRINLPQIIDIKVPIVIKKSDKTILAERINIQDAFLELCYKNCSILFAKPEYGLHSIIPNNLRELIEWLIFLTKGENSNGDRISEFKEYFFKAYCKSKLSPNQFNVLNRIALTSIDHFNITIIREIVTLIKGEIINNQFEENYIFGFDNDDSLTEITSIIQRGNYPHNISLGDLKLFFDMVLRYYPDKELDNLIFSIKTLITINLKKSLIENNLNSFNSIVGISIYNQKEKPLLVAGRSFFKLNYGVLTIGDESIKEFYNSINARSDVLSDQNISKIQIFEWFHYFVFSVDITDKYRLKEKEQITNKSLRFFENVGTQMWGQFDLLAPFIFIENSEIHYSLITDSILKSKNDIYELHSFKTKISKWKEENKIYFPFESFEQIEVIFKKFRTDYKEKKKDTEIDEKRSLLSYFDFYINELRDQLDSFHKLHSYYSILPARAYIIDNPIFKEISSKGENIFKAFIDKDLNKSYKREDSLDIFIQDEINKMKSSYIENGKTGTYLFNQFGKIIGSKGLGKYNEENKEVNVLITKIKDIREQMVDKKQNYTKTEIEKIFKETSDLLNDWLTQNGMNE